MRDFLYSDQIEFPVAYDAIKFFDTDIQVSIELCSEGSIKLSGDVALIAMPNSLEESKSLGKTVKMLTLNDMINNWKQDKENLKVYKRGATTGLTSGEITRPAHVKIPISTAQLFEQHTSKALSNRPLLNQILVSGSKFGDFGDSGSMVYHDRDPMDLSSKIYAVGTFLGKLDRADHLYIVTPSSDFFAANGFEFAGTVLSSSF